MSTRQRVLDALSATPGGVSGEQLAAESGVSRAAIAKHVAALKALGYQIEARPGEGYRLIAAPTTLVPEEVVRLVVDPLWAHIEGSPVTASTNDDARALARKGAVEGTVVVAGCQTAGRGRMGRTWESPSGGAYLSAVLRPAVAPAEVASLSLAIGVGIIRGLERMGVHASLKWPNDVWLGEAKLAGVLLEMAAEADRVDWVIAGTGINVIAPAEHTEGAAYLSDVVADASAAEVAALVLDGIASAYRDWLAGGFGALREEYRGRLVLAGRSITVRDSSGTVRAEGVVDGVDAEGRLLVTGPAGTQAVVAGEVTLRG